MSWRREISPAVEAGQRQGVSFPATLPIYLTVWIKRERQRERESGVVLSLIVVLHWC